MVRAASLRAWRFFCDVDLSDAAETRFRSLHHGFTRTPYVRGRGWWTGRRMCWSARATPSLVRAGRLSGLQALQVKGQPYTLDELLADPAQAEIFRDGTYVTLRLTAGMYHRFHAPQDCRVEAVTHVFGDTWNVNPVTLRRVKRLFCRNERAVVRTTFWQRAAIRSRW